MTTLRKLKENYILNKAIEENNLLSARLVVLKIRITTSYTYKTVDNKSIKEMLDYCNWAIHIITINCSLSRRLNCNNPELNINNYKELIQFFQ